jgi:hypothetical protein
MTHVDSTGTEVRATDRARPSGSDSGRPSGSDSGGPVRDDGGPARRRRARQVTEAVVAGYIHAISHAGGRGSRRAQQLTPQAV